MGASPSTPSTKSPRPRQVEPHVGDWSWYCPACDNFHQCTLSKHLNTPPSRAIAKIDKDCRCKVFAKRFPESIRFGQSYTSLARNPHSWLTFHVLMRTLRTANEDPDLGLPWTTEHARKDRCGDKGFDFKARIVDGRLLVRDREWEGIARVCKEKHRRWELFHHLCPHLKGSGITNADCDRVLNGAITHLQQHWDAEGGNRGFMFRLYRCKDCPTEIAVQVFSESAFDQEVSRRAKKKGYVLSLSRYIDFGVCETPAEMEWRSLTTWIKRPYDVHDVSYKDSSHWVPRFALDETWFRGVRPRLDITTEEPLCARFEKENRVKLPFLVEHDADWMAPPTYRP